MSLDADARGELAALAAAARLRVPRVYDGAQGVVVQVDGRELVSFASNDYLGLASDPRLARAAAEELARSGAGAGSSRLVIGNHRAHVELERAVAGWLQVAGVRLFGSGYAANVGVLSTLAREGDVVISDALNHASIIDGCRLGRARVVVTPHGDVGALEAGLRSAAGASRRLVVTESVFSMDGDVADLAAIASLCRRYDAVLIVDEAHAIGAMGPEGRGIAAAAGVVPDVMIGTFGKALGSFGAFAASSQAVAELLWNRARSFVFSTALPPSVAAAGRIAVELVRGSEGVGLRRNLYANACALRKAVPALGGGDGSPIAPLLVGDDAETMRLAASLIGDGLLVQGIRPPTVPVGTARLRLSVSASHSAAHIAELARALAHRDVHKPSASTTPRAAACPRPGR